VVKGTISRRIDVMHVALLNFSKAKRVLKVRSDSIEDWFLRGDASCTGDLRE